MSDPSEDETVQLLKAMGAVCVKMPTMQLAIAQQSLPPELQTEFGDLLISLGTLVREHAQGRLNHKLGTESGAYAWANITRSERAVYRSTSC